ncbi:hypothetical protein GCM10027082_39250 [Comamonas humi]
MDRRQLIQISFALGGGSLFSIGKAADDKSPEWGAEGRAERDEWMESVMVTRSFDTPGSYSKFSDGMFYMQAPLIWRPNNLSSDLRSVTVPKGFVTDLTSIPRPFWSLMPRDGAYADAAIVHDYLYWMQKGSRLTADETLKEAMKDLEVHPFNVEIIYHGVRSIFGEMAWKNNAKLRKEGESRQLKKYPATSAVKWADWKKQSGNVVGGW